MTSCMIFLFCNKMVILSSGSILRSSMKIRNEGMDTETIAVGGRGQGDDGEEMWRGGCKIGA